MGKNLTGEYLQAGICLKVSHPAGAVVSVVVPVHCHKLCLLLLLLLPLLMSLVLLLLLPRVCTRRRTILLAGICCHRMCLVLLLLRLPLFRGMPLLLLLLLLFVQKFCGERIPALLTGMHCLVKIIQPWLSCS